MSANDVQRTRAERTVLLVTAGMGGGHLGAARQIADRMAGTGRHAPIIDLSGRMRFGYGRFISGFYRAQLRYAMASYRAVYDTWRNHPERMRFANRVNTVMARRGLCAAVDEHRPVAILSTYNLATQVLGELVADGTIDVPVTTFITDFGVHPYWLHPAMSAYATVHPTTAEAVRAHTNAPVGVTGPFVDPAFAPDQLRRAVTRDRLGAADDEPVALVVAGAWGVGDVEATVADLEAIGDVTPVVVCGDNPRLVRRVRHLVGGAGRVFGHVDTMPALMDAADVLVENAGGLTAMEAFASGLPVVTHRPIPAHGTDNARAMAAARVTRLAADRESLGRLVHAAVAAGPVRRAMIAAGRAVARPDATAVLTGLVDPGSPPLLRAVPDPPGTRTVTAGDGTGRRHTADRVHGRRRSA